MYGLHCNDSLVAHFLCCFVDEAVVCLVSGVTYTVNLTLPAVLILIPTFSDLLNSTEGALCLSQLLTAQTERDEVCTQLEYSVMSQLYSTALCMCTAKSKSDPLCLELLLSDWSYHEGATPIPAVDQTTI